MPKVTTNIRVLGWLSLVLACTAHLAVQQAGKGKNSTVAGPAATLYEQLRAVALDPSRVYKIRDASLDRSSLHFSFNDGTIAFTKDVAGRITGAFFAGDGEVLLSPPNQTERSSMALFTGSAILEEKFLTAYLRFNDDTFKELEPRLRPDEDDADAFMAQCGEGARVLAEGDALRLLTSFSGLLPDKRSPPHEAHPLYIDSNDRMLHARVQGAKLGIFDLFFDLTAGEQISAGQFKAVDAKSNYDVWTSFAIRHNPTGETVSEIAGDQENRGDVVVSKYSISARIKPPTQLDAEARLEIVVRRGGARTVFFELSRYLDIREVQADGHNVEFIHNPSLEGTSLERRGDDLVAVVFSEPLQTGEKIELRFVYGGSVLSDAGAGLLYVGDRGTWYPNRGLSKSTFDLKFVYPQTWTLIATGDRLPDSSTNERAGKEKDSQDRFTTAPGEQVSRWRTERPIPIAGFNLGKYSHAAKRAGAVTVDVYAASGMERSFPQSLQSEPVLAPSPVFTQRHSIPMVVRRSAPSASGNEQTVAAAAAQAINFYSLRFGAYPYSSLAVTQMPGSLSQGWPGLIYLSSFSFLTADQKSALHFSPVERVMSDAVISHETAHQWWGDLVTWNGYRDQWIAEGLANYSALLLLESQNPAQFRAVMLKYRDDLLQKNKDGLRLIDAGPVTLGARLSSSKFSAGYETIAYERGAWLFHMLRTLMRDEQYPRGIPKASTDEPFFQALRTLGAQYNSKPIGTAELIKVFEKHLPAAAWHDGKQSLDWFSEGWVNGTAVPEFSLRGIKFADKTGATIATGSIRQKESPENLVSPVPIYAALAGKTVFLGRVFTDGLETPFHLEAPLGTRKLLLDPYQTVLSRSR